MTDTEKAALERRIDELCAEVEQLRNQLHDQQDTAEHNFVRNAREYKRVCDENAKLREYVTRLEQANIVLDSDNTDLLCDMKDMQLFITENAKLRALCADMVKMLVLACWASVESDEEASQCIYRAEALGIEVPS